MLERLAAYAHPVGLYVLDLVALASHSGIDDQLMPALDTLARDANCQPPDLSLVGVSTGPGGFTGLRIAVATAQMLAEATGCALVDVPTAMVCAKAAGLDAGTIAVTLASKGTSTWCTLVDAATMQIKGTPGLIEASHVPELLKDAVLLLGDEHLPGPITHAAEALGLDIWTPEWCPRACLELAEAECAAGRRALPEDLLPTYPRAPEAVALFDARQKPS